MIVIFSRKGRKELKGFANYAFFAAHHISLPGILRELGSLKS